MSAIPQYNLSDDLEEKGWNRSEPLFSVSSGRDTLFPAGAFYIPMRSFSSEGMKILSDKPVEVKVYSENNSYFAENAALHIYSVGNTIEEAKDDFIEQVVHFYSYYISLNQNDVTEQAEQVKLIYDTHFQDISEKVA